MIKFNAGSYFPSHQSTVFLNDFSSYESFSYSGINIFYEILIELSFILSQNIAIVLMLFVFGLVNIILFNDINKLILKTNDEIMIANILFLLSSIFMLTMSTFSYLPIIITLMLWTIGITLKNPRAAVIPILVGLFINLQIFIINLCAALIIFLLLKSRFRIIKFTNTYKIKDYTKINILIPLIALGIMIFYNYIIKTDVFITKIDYSNIVLGNNIYSTPLIYLILGIFALFSELKDTKLIVITLIMFILSFFNIYIGLLFLFITIILAAIGVKNLINRKWFVKELRTPVIFLLILLFLFTSISFSESVITSGPGDNLINDIGVMQDFKSINNDEQKVFGDVRDCEIIQLYSHQEVYYSSLKYESKENKKLKLNITEEMLSNSNLDVMTKFFQENNISIVFISKEILNERWSRTDRGLLFLLTQSNRFVKINGTSESLVFYYVGETEEVEE
jgi:hypothetical protein